MKLHSSNARRIRDQDVSLHLLPTSAESIARLVNDTTASAEGVFADFDCIDVHQPHTYGLTRPIPYGRSIWLASLRPTTGLTASDGRLAWGVTTRFVIADRKLSRVALRFGLRYVTVDEDGGVTLAVRRSGTAQTFQWIETPTGELMLMSLATNRFLRIDPQTGEIRADSPGPMPDDSDGALFIWSEYGKRGGSTSRTLQE